MGKSDSTDGDKFYVADMLLPVPVAAVYMNMRSYYSKNPIQYSITVLSNPHALSPRLSFLMFLVRVFLVLSL